MKKLSIMLLVIVLLFAFSTTALAVNADQSQTLTYRELGIVIDGQELAPTDANGKAVEPFIMKDTTYLPLRAVANALGLQAHWNGESYTVTLNSGATPYFGTGTPLATKVSKKATLSYRDIRIILDGKTLVPLSADGKSAEPFIIDGVTYLPLRALAEALGVNVHWVGSRNMILLTSPADDPSIDELMEQWLKEHPDYGATVIIPGGTGEETASEYPVFFDLGGKGSSFVQTVKKGEAATEPDPAPTATGYEFDGWYNGAEKWVFTNPITAATVLTAQWKPITYTIKFDANAKTATGTMADLTGVEYDATKQLTKNTFTRPFYRFVEWNTEKDGSGESYADKERVRNLPTTDNAITLYAQWEYLEGYLCFTAKADGSTVKLAKTGSPAAIDLVYSLDEQTWNAFSPDSTTATLDTGESVYIKAKTTNATFSKDNKNYYSFVLTGKLSVIGNIMSLVDETCQNKTVTNFMFYKLFCLDDEADDANKQALTDASELLLPAETLEKGCYASMFYNCTALQTAPTLPATTLAQDCYNGMFYNCTVLETAPTLPATTLAKKCYKFMFYRCKALETAPTLPATTLVEGCYYSMFCGCTDLNSITVSFTSWDNDGTATDATFNWVKDVKTTSGTFTGGDGLDTTIYDDSHIPTSWRPNDN